mgnify:CR=1 FL=1
MELAGKIEKVVQSLPVKLTQEEIVECAKSLAKTTNELRDCEARKMEVTSQFAADLKKLKATTDSISIKISNGYEHRDVECSWSFDYVKDTKTLTRLDTGEIVRTSQLTIEDRQGKLL